MAKNVVYVLGSQLNCPKTSREVVKTGVIYIESYGPHIHYVSVKVTRLTYHSAFDPDQAYLMSQHLPHGKSDIGS